MLKTFGLSEYLYTASLLVEMLKIKLRQKISLFQVQLHFCRTKKARQLNVVFCATVMSRILYALPVWDELFTNELIGKSDDFLKKKTARWSYNCELKCLFDLLHEADAHLFRKMANNTLHCIHQLLHPAKILPMILRHSHRLFALPQCHFDPCKRSFVLRNLFNDAYWIIVG